MSRIDTIDIIAIAILAGLFVFSLVLSWQQISEKEQQPCPIVAVVESGEKSWAIITCDSLRYQAIPISAVMAQEITKYVEE